VQPAAEARQTAALTGFGGGLDVKRYCSSSKARSYESANRDGIAGWHHSPRAPAAQWIEQRFMKSLPRSRDLPFSKPSDRKPSRPPAAAKLFELLDVCVEPGFQSGVPVRVTDAAAMEHLGYRVGRVRQGFSPVIR
jgi:hypothetical protein